MAPQSPSKKAESELAEITIHGVGFESRKRFPEEARTTRSILSLDETEGDVAVVLVLFHDDQNLDAMLAPGGKYSVTIRREEG